MRLTRTRLLAIYGLGHITSILVMGCVFYGVGFQVTQQLATENQALRDRNAVIERSKRLPNSGGVDDAAVRAAHYWTQIPYGLAVGIRLAENGPETGMECGYHGKSQFVVANVRDPQQWQYVEAARLAERAAWAFCQEHRAEYLEFLGRRYTGGGATKYAAWGRGVGRLWDMADADSQHTGGKNGKD